MNTNPTRQRGFASLARRVAVLRLFQEFLLLFFAYRLVIRTPPKYFARIMGQGGQR